MLRVGRIIVVVHPVISTSTRNYLYGYTDRHLITHLCSSSQTSHKVYPFKDSERKFQVLGIPYCIYGLRRKSCIERCHQRGSHVRATRALHNIQRVANIELIPSELIPSLAIATPSRPWTLLTLARSPLGTAFAPFYRPLAYCDVGPF